MKKVLFLLILVLSVFVISCGDDDDSNACKGITCPMSTECVVKSGEPVCVNGDNNGDNNGGNNGGECSSFKGSWGCSNDYCTCSEGPKENDECGEDSFDSCGAFCEYCAD